MATARPWFGLVLARARPMFDWFVVIVWSSVKGVLVYVRQLHEHMFVLVLTMV